MPTQSGQSLGTDERRLSPEQLTINPSLWHRHRKLPSQRRAGANVERWAADDKVFEPCYTLYIRLSFGVGGAIGSLPSDCAWQGLGPQFNIAAAMAARRLIDSRHGH
ncbi:MAG: hypothetical protein LC667_09025 [Thioalkalivibrio sp.]|nr:hypothetical protein [Thioalkalivibrio sp.]